MIDTKTLTPEDVVAVLDFVVASFLAHHTSRTDEEVIGFLAERLRNLVNFCHANVATAALALTLSRLMRDVLEKDN